MVRRTWSLKGQTPVIKSSGSWQGLTLAGAIIASPWGYKPNLLLKVFRGSVKSKQIIIYLKELRRHLGRRKLLLIWDGLPAHRARLIKDYLKQQKNQLRIERFPAYAPELNPIEYLWSAIKTKDLANLSVPDLTGLRRAVYRGKRRLQKNQQVLKGFLRASKLYR